MRHYMPKRKNPDYMPHNVYMQMLYLIRDYYEGDRTETKGRKEQHRLVENAAQKLQESYSRRRDVFDVLDPLRAFFDYPYFSVMFSQTWREMGASKRSWKLYRCRFARQIAEKMDLLPIAKATDEECYL
ncbi:MAG: hypothetical protein IKW06_04645 [Clostridia bacterium]|nr:hypothetical protein [Clostridia bacterium]